MHRLWRRAGVTERADRLALTSAIVRRPITSSSELSAIEGHAVASYLEQLDDEGVLAARVAVFLAKRRPPPEPEPVFTADDGEFALFEVSPQPGRPARWDDPT